MYAHLYRYQSCSSSICLGYVYNIFWFFLCLCLLVSLSPFFMSLSLFLFQERDAYLPLAESASKMYFVITDLSKINNMYRFSLASFLRLFQRALQAKKVTHNSHSAPSITVFFPSQPGFNTSSLKGISNISLIQ